MANLTISVDEETLKRARIRAIERGESVNRVLAQHLRDYASATDDAVASRQRATLDGLVAYASQVGASGDGSRFRREDAYQERIDPTH